MKLTNGTRSIGASRCPHASQAERAAATGRPRGQRRMRTPEPTADDRTKQHNHPSGEHTSFCHLPLSLPYHEMIGDGRHAD